MAAMSAERRLHRNRSASGAARRGWLAAFLVVGTTLSAADWPQWRGPSRTAVSAETGLLASWPAEGPRLLWRVSDLGAGYSTPAVAGNRLFVLVNRGVEDELLQARSIADGKLVWQVRLGSVGNPDQQPSYPGSRSTPTVTADTVYALGSNGDLVAVDRRDGRERWRRQLRQDFGGKPGTWAYAESLLVDGDTLVVSPGGETALVALHRKTGKETWRSRVPGGEDAAYSSAMPFRVGSVKQYVQFLQKGLVGIDAATGALLWRYDIPAVGSAANMASPIARGDVVFATTNQGGGGFVRLTGVAGGVTATPLHFEKKLGIGAGGAVLVGDHLYGANSQGLLAMAWETGTIAWHDRSVGAGAVAAAEGRLYVRGESGEVALVDASPAGYRERGRFTPVDPPDRGKAKAWPHPVIAGGRLYLRDLGVLWAYDIRAPKG
jgi:outer membrane protein assembly factor BamB